jgi:membrane associated rhomboid family serine protease
MLDDRSYMRDSSYGGQRSLTTTLLIVNAAIFVIHSLLEYYGLFRVVEYFALSTTGLARGFIWQLVTYQFLHGGFFHLLVNLIAIFFFGRAMEEALGRSSFLKLYFAGGIVGGLLQIVLALLFPTAFGGAVVGASACAFALVAAFATMFPDRTITLLIFFILPVSMRARTLLWISLAIAIFGIVVPSGHIADGAHLGGIIAGFLFVKWFVQGEGWTIRLPTFRRPERRPPEFTRPPAAPSRRSFWQNPKPSSEGPDLPPAEFISREVDPILDKISAEGIHSLTERERKILEAARAKMAKR